MNDKELKQEVERLRLEVIDQEIKLQASEERVKQLEEWVEDLKEDVYNGKSHISIRLQTSGEKLLKND